MINRLLPENLQSKYFNIFLIVIQNIGSWYKLEQSWHGGSNEYPQSMFSAKIRKIDILFCTCIYQFRCISGVFGWDFGLVLSKVFFLNLICFLFNTYSHILKTV